MTWLRAFSIWGRCPQSPEIYRVIRQNGWSFWGTGYARPHAIPAAESALGSHLCVALSSAQVLPGWTTSTSPCNDFSANGDYPLNFVSHPRGSLQSFRVFAHGRQARKAGDGPSAGGFAWINGNPMRL